MEEDFCQYNDVFDEPSKVEQIVSDAIGNIKEHFTNQVKDAIQKAESINSEIVSLEEEKNRLQYEIEHKKRELEKLEEEFTNARTFDIPRRYRGRIMKEHTKNFVPGQKVWTTSREVTYYPCDYCNGTGKVEATIGENKTEVRCPMCDGSRKITRSKYVAMQEKIRKVSLKLTFDNEGTHIWSNDCIVFYGNDCWRTVHNVFETEEEARERAKELNEKSDKK